LKIKAVVLKTIKKQKLLFKILLRLYTWNKVRRSITFTVETTTKCNLKCKFCPLYIVDRPKINMEFELFQKLIEIIKNYKHDKKQIAFSLTGLGEPFLNPNQLEFMRMVRSEFPKAKISVDSNFTCVRKEQIERMVRQNLVDNLVISYNYPRKDLYEKLCGNGYYWEQVGLNLDVLYNYLLRHKSNIAVYLGMKKYKQLSENESNNWQRSIERKYDNKFCVAWSDILNWGGIVNVEDFIYCPINQRLNFPCYGLLIEHYVIDVFGKVYPCCCAISEHGNKELLLGDIFKDSFFDMREIRRRILDDHQNGEWTKYKMCSNCSMYAAKDYDVLFNILGRWR
jgi:radical SAM protein with 4Fe4S-binding SPASM domain